MPLDKKRKAATPLIKRPCRAASGNAAAKGEAVCARAHAFSFAEPSRRRKCLRAR
jgi:hypothetical protein